MASVPPASLRASLSAGDPAPPRDPGLGAWRAFHLFYHGDRHQALRRLVAPLLAELVAEGLADHFYFIHYGLGGPHLRLRFRAAAGRQEELAARVERRAAEFLSAFPSKESLSEEELLRRNEVFLRDSQEEDSAIYPDNSLREFPPRFEIERYGGAALFPASLDFFAVSSVEALRFLQATEGKSASQLIPFQLRFLIRQAWGFARGGEELARLVAYPQETWGEAMRKIADRADGVFAGQGEALTALLRRELAGLPAETPPLAAAARRLGALTLAAPPGDRWRIGWSQLHMSANRLGLRNPDEVYLGRLLQLAAAAELQRDPAQLEAAWALPEPRGGEGQNLAIDVLSAFAGASPAASPFNAEPPAAGR